MGLFRYSRELVKVDCHFDSLLTLVACGTNPVTNQGLEPLVAGLYCQGTTYAHGGGDNGFCYLPAGEIGMVVEDAALNGNVVVSDYQLL